MCKGYINEESFWCSASMNVMFSYLAWKSRPLSLCQIEVTFKESRPFFTEFLPIVVLKKDKKYLTNLKKVLYHFISSMKGFFSKIGVFKEGQNNEQVGNSKVCFACSPRKYVLMCREERIYMSYIYQRFVFHAPFLLSPFHESTMSLSFKQHLPMHVCTKGRTHQNSFIALFFVYVRSIELSEKESLRRKLKS